MTLTFPRAATALCFLASVLLLGQALQVSNGFYDETALAMVVAALVATVIGVLLHRWSALTSSTTPDRVISAAALLGVLWQLWTLATAPPVSASLPASAQTALRATLAAEALVIGLGMMRWPRWSRLWLAICIVLHCGVAWWFLRAVPAPDIDVITVHTEALRALFHGQDPYRITFENIYGADAVHFYNPSLIVGGRLTFGFPYPPLSLLLSAPAALLAGDFRIAGIIGIAVACWLIGTARSNRLAPLVACLLLTTPRLFYVFEQGWTEPIVIGLVALAVRLLDRTPARAGWAVGLALAVKQYMPFTGLLALRALWGAAQERAWRLGTAAAIGLLVTLPFALWHPHAFVRSAVWLQTQEPFRTDALSVLSWADRHGWGRGTFLWAVGAGIAGSLVGLASTVPTAAGYAASTALTLLLMFVFGSKAFCNYYVCVIGVLCCAIALLPSPDAPTTRTTAR